jgi:hypothetical protein
MSPYKHLQSPVITNTVKQENRLPVSTHPHPSHAAHHVWVHPVYIKYDSVAFDGKDIEEERGEQRRG